MRKADWWIHWQPDICKGEMTVWLGPKAVSEKLEKAQGVVFVGETEVAGGEPYGAFFPLWRPGKNANEQPRKTGGLFSQIRPVKISEPMVATWDWNSDLDEQKRDIATVIPRR